MATQTPFRENRQSRITRASATVPVLCHATTPDVIDFRGASGGQLIVPDNAAAGNVTVYVNGSETGTFVPLIDAAGDAVVIAVEENKAYDLPEAVYAAAFVQLRAEAEKEFTGSLVVKG